MTALCPKCEQEVEVKFLALANRHQTGEATIPVRCKSCGHEWQVGVAIPPLDGDEDEGQ